MYIFVNSQYCIFTKLTVCIYYLYRTKVGVYTDSNTDSDKKVGKDMLSNGIKTFKENSISDLDLYFEDGGEALIYTYEKQLPPQNHFINNI